MILTKFSNNSNLESDELSFACYCYNIFPGAMTLNVHFSLCVDVIQQMDAYLTLTVIIGIIET